MSARRFQGLALVLSGVGLLLGYFVSDSNLVQIIIVIGIFLFILGVPATHTVQQAGTIGLIGIVLLELAAVIALGFQLDLLTGPGLVSILSPTSAIAGMLGRIIIGWLTTRKNVFPAWVGWAFIAEGVLNFLGGVIDLSALAGVFPIVLLVLGAAALLGYGFFIFQKQA